MFDRKQDGTCVSNSWNQFVLTQGRPRKSQSHTAVGSGASASHTVRQARGRG